MRAVVGEKPGSHIAGLAAGHAHDYIAVPGPSMLAIIFAGLGRMIGMGMIPADEVQSLIFGSALGGAKILGRNGKTIARRVVAPISKREKQADLASLGAIKAEHGSASLVGIIPGTVAPDRLSDLFVNDEHEIGRWE
jgi:hypothetical protein